MLPKRDRSNLAGEFYTLAELYKRGYNAFITLGKGKQIDIIVKGKKKSLAIEVKARASQGQFLAQPVAETDGNKIWCFVDLYAKNFPDNQPKFYLIGASDLIRINRQRRNALQRRERESGKRFNEFSLKDVRISDLTPFLNKWGIIDKSLR